MMIKQVRTHMRWWSKACAQWVHSYVVGVGGES